ncbi:MAG: 50S ribosomal protein L18 [Chlamydiae bacterium]|nr:50S ribosomal protein L18 [Chlamydiota bacterium]
MEKSLEKRNLKRQKRVFRVRKKILGTAKCPRLSVFRSNKHLSAQLIDDENQKTLFFASTLSPEIKTKKKSKEAAKEIGKRIGESAKKNQIDSLVFDRRWYKFHGLIAELANAIREEGIKF